MMSNKAAAHLVLISLAELRSSTVPGKNTLKENRFFIGSEGSGRARQARGRWFSLALLTAISLVLLLSLGASVQALGGDEQAQAENAAAPGKVMVVVIDRIGIDDITPSSAPNILKLMARGSTSLMNARVKYDLYGLGSYVVVGSGGRALGGLDSGLSFNHSELLETGTGGSVPAADIYDSRTGRRASPGQVLNLYIEEMKKKSDTQQATSMPGLMGQALREGRRRVTVLGNADSLIPSSSADILPTPSQPPLVAPPVELAEPQPVGSLIPGMPRERSSYPLTSYLHREIACIAMDENGMTPAGDVSSLLVAPYSVREGSLTDFGALENQASALLPSTDVMVIDTGQTSRVDEQADFYTEAALARARSKALRQSDKALGSLQSLLDLRKDLLVVCTPTPTRKMISEGELLTPLVIAGQGFGGGGQIHSATTRRTGLVSNFDIAPTVIEASGLKVPSDMDGRALTPKGSATDLEGLKRLRDQAVSTYTSRRVMIRVYVITSMCVIALFFVVMLVRSDAVGRHPYFWSISLLSVLAGPFVWLAIAAMGAVPLVVQIVVAVVSCIGIALLSLLLRERVPDAESVKLSGVLLRPMMAISGFTVLLIMLDSVLGSPLMTFSAFGSDIILGDRYYGMGNLFFGFALGAAILFTCLALQTRDRGLMGRLRLDKPWKRYAFASIVLGAVAFIVGFPKFGADFGGLLAAVVAGLVTIIRLEGKPLTAKRIAVVVLILIVCVGGLLVLDTLMPGSASHAGRAIGKAQSGGISSLAAQVGRKLGASWTLTWTSIWRLLLLFGLVAWLVFNWRYGILACLKENYPYLSAGFWGLVVGLVLAWVFNDSGIESASALSVFLFVPYLVMLVRWRRPEKATVETG